MVTKMLDEMSDDDVLALKLSTNDISIYDLTANEAWSGDDEPKTGILDTILEKTGIRKR